MWKRSVAWFLLLLVLITGLLVGLLAPYEQKRLETLELRERERMGVAARNLLEAVWDVHRDLQALSRLPALTAYGQHPGGHAQEDLIDHLMFYCQTHELLTQLRVIRTDGPELIRIDQREGVCYRLPDSQLQNKKDRYYLQEAVRLLPGEIYRSPLDLNVEQGQVEQPRRPMLRFGVRAASGERMLLFLNLDGDRLLEENLGVLPFSETLGVTNLLLNRQGYYLFSPPDPSLEFGFMEERPSARLSEREPLVWAAIQNGEARERTAAGLFLIERLPLPTWSGGEEDEVWYLVRLITVEGLMKTSLMMNPYRWPLLGLYLLLLAGISRVLAERGRRQAEARRTRREVERLGQRFQTLYDQSPEAYLILDPVKRRFLGGNAAAGQLLRASPEELCGLDPAALYSPSALDGTPSDPRVLEARFRQLALQEGFECECWLRRCDGQTIWADVRAKGIELEGDQVALVLMRDTTELKQARLALEASETRFRQLADAAPVLIWEAGLDKGCHWFNRGWLEFTGRTLEQERGEGWVSGVHPDDRARCLAVYTSHFDRHEPFAMEYRLRRHDGTYRWLMDHGTPIFDASGQLSGYLGSCIDISDQHEAYERARFFQRLVDHASDAVIAQALDGTVQFWNAAAEGLLHYPAAEMIGQSIQRLIPPALRAEEAQAMAEIRAGRPVATLETQRLTREGTPQEVSLSLSPIRDESGRLIAVAQSLRDLTEQKAREVELRAARAEAESASRAKSQFLANMSHEIRTPLNSVIGQAWLLKQRTDLDPETGGALDRIHQAGQLLLTLVNDILDMSKIEAGELRLEQTPLRLEPLIDELQALVKPMAVAKGLDLQIGSLPPAARGYLIGDPTRLRQILLNLLANAVKFTERGRITLRVERSEPAAPDDAVAGASPVLRFQVIDEGIGIPAEVLSRLFQPFQQGDDSTTRHHGGTGLGLAIVKHLAEAMGGGVQVESSPGQGSCFTVELPLPSASDREREEADLGKSRFRFLLAEDEAAQREALTALCRGFGWEVEAFAEGESLIRRYEALLTEGLSVDGLILDWQMPTLDGLQTLARLHETHRPEQLPASLMVTAHEVARLRESSHAALADAILTKPVVASQLFNQMGVAFKKHFGTTEGLMLHSNVASSALLWLADLQILVVDDSPMNLDLARMILEREGARISTCQDGAEALAWLQAPGHRVDVVLMDVQMPVMDGNTAVRKIRQIEALRALPVIALTAGALASEREKSLQAGMDDYLTKPLDPQRLVRVIRQQLEARGRSPQVIERPVEAKKASGPSLTEPVWPQIKGIDTAAARTLAQDDLALYRELLQRFVEENRDLEPLLEDPFDEKAPGGWQARLHKLAGNAGVIGANPLCTLAKAIENGLREQPPAAFSDELVTLRVEYRALAQEIRRVLQQEAGGSDPGKGEEASLAEAELAVFREALGKRQIAANGLYRSLRPTLSQALPEAAFQRLETAMVALDFAEALKILEAL